MKPRHCYRLNAKQRANAERCGVALSEWVALPRNERKKRLKKARKKARKKGDDDGRTRP